MKLIASDYDGTFKTDDANAALLESKEISMTNLYDMLELEEMIIEKLA